MDGGLWKPVVIATLLACWVADPPEIEAQARFLDERPVYVRVSEGAGFSRAQEPVELEIELSTSDAAAINLVDFARSRVRVFDVRAEPAREIPSQVFDLRVPGDGSRIHVRVAFFADVEANSSARYRIDRTGTSIPSYSTDLQVTGDGVGWTIDTQHLRVLTNSISGQIEQIDLKFATRPQFRFAPGVVHWNPDYMYVPLDYPVTDYSWRSARDIVDPDREIEHGPIFFSIRRKQIIPDQNENLGVEVYYRFYAGKPWYVMESTLEALKEFRTFGIRNDEHAFGVGDFTHAGWRTESTGLHPRQRGEVGSIPIYDHSRLGRHLLGSSLSPNLPWVSYSDGERGYAAASLRLGWDNRNHLTGGPAPLVNSRTVLSDNEGAPYWFRSLVYTPRRANDPEYFNLPQETINEMLQLIPRGSTYFERNVYFFYPFDWETNYTPPDELYLRLSQPLIVEVEPV